jgi:hypothetical protein
MPVFPSQPSAGATVLSQHVSTDEHMDGQWAEHVLSTLLATAACLHLCANATHVPYVCSCLCYLLSECGTLANVLAW